MSAAERAQPCWRSSRARTGVTVVSRATAVERAEEVTLPVVSPLRAAATAPRAAESAYDERSTPVSAAKCRRKAQLLACVPPHERSTTNRAPKTGRILPEAMCAAGWAEARAGMARK